MRIRAVQNRHIRTSAASAGPFVDQVSDVTGFVLLVKGAVEQDGFTVFTIGTQLFTEASLVIGDDGIGGLKNGRCGAVVLFQFDHFHIGEIVLEVTDIIDIGATPAID